MTLRKTAQNLWQRHAAPHLGILLNAGSLVGTMALNSGLGFLYWWAAAHLFSAQAVGLASAAVSAMMLLGNLGMLGLGTLLLGELPRQPSRQVSLIVAALSVSGLVGLVVGLAFTVFTPLLAAELGVLAASILNAALFGLGVGLTSASLVLDQALVGLGRGVLQLRRNFIFSVAKLVLLVAVGLWWIDQLGLGIYATWVVGIVISLLGVAVMAWARGIRPSDVVVGKELVRGLGGPALVHHALNLALLAPGLVLPLIVTSVLSAEVNASFYVAWMMASLVFVAPDALATVLYSASVADRPSINQRLRLTLGLSTAVGVLGNLVLLFIAGFLLRLFGAEYVARAEGTLHILALGVFPIIIKDHFVALRRIEGHIGVAAIWMAVGGLLEVVLAAVGAQRAGLTGLSMGWVLALCIEGLLAAPSVLRQLRRSPSPVASQGSSES